MNNEKLPQEFLNNFEMNFGKENLQKYLESFDKESIKGLRVHSEFNNFCNEYEKVPYFFSAYYIPNEQKLGNTVLHQMGAFYIQEPSSMIPVASVSNFDFENKLILDLCASPGGKSTQISQLMKGTGLLVSNEIDYSRAKTLFSNIERIGIKNSVVLSESPKNLEKNFSGVFDYIFVDAPCSGEGMFRKDSIAIDEWNNSLAEYNHKRQLDILSSADKMLKNNGIIVYSTCTFNTIENEQTVDEFCGLYNYEIQKPNDVILPYTMPGKIINENKKLENTRHFFPFVASGEGQFVAILKKKSLMGNEIIKAKNKGLQLSKQELLIAQREIKKVLNIDLEKYDFYKIQNKICIAPKNNLELDKLNVLSIGAIVGEIVKDRIEFHHQFFKVFGENCKNKIDLKYDSQFVKNYMKGEQLDLSVLKKSSDIILLEILSNGYGIIQANGVNLGGIKVVDNQIKNHYPKVLRMSNLT